MARLGRVSDALLRYPVSEEGGLADFSTELYVQTNIGLLFNESREGDWGI